MYECFIYLKFIVYIKLIFELLFQYKTVTFTSTYNTLVMSDLIRSLRDSTTKSEFETNLIDLIYFELDKKKIEYLKVRKKQILKNNNNQYVSIAPWYVYRGSTLCKVKYLKISKDIRCIYDGFNEDHLHFDNSAFKSNVYSESDKLDLNLIYPHFFKSIIIPKGVSFIGTQSLHYCAELTSLVIPSTLQYIGHQAFFNCKNLKSVSIPKSVDEIGEFAFDECKHIEKICIRKKFKGRMKNIFGELKNFKYIDIKYTS